MPENISGNLSRGRAPVSPAERRWWLWGIRRALAQNNAELFHGTNFEVPYLPGIPSVLTIHDLSPWRNREWHDDARRVRIRTPWLVRLRRARMIITVSEAIRREVISHFHISPDLVRSVPLAAAPEFQPLPPSPSTRRFFLFVGTLEPRKNISALIKAWSATKHLTSTDLIIAGRNRADFAGIIPQPGLHLLGEVPDEQLPRLYSDALAFVYPSHYEGFGLPVLEAMQSGCPVVTSADAAITEVAAGAAIHADTPQSLAEALTSIAGNPDLRASFRAAGLARAATFSWSRTARETHAVYTCVLGSSPAKQP